MNTPTIYTPESLRRKTEDVQCGLPDGRWVAARPMGWQGLRLRSRVLCAWMVFTGRWDVLRNCPDGACRLWKGGLRSPESVALRAALEGMGEA